MAPPRTWQTTPQGIFVRTALSADDMEWLRAESDKLGITPGQFIRVIVRHMRESGASARFDINVQVPKARGRSPTYEELVCMDDMGNPPGVDPPATSRR